MPTSGQLSESEAKHLRLRVKQLICGSLSRMRIRQSLLQPYRPPMVQQLGAGVQGLWRNPWARAAVECRKANPGDVRAENVVGNACGGKPGSHGSKAIESCVGGGAINIASRPHTPSLAAERQKGWPIKRA